MTFYEEAMRDHLSGLDRCRVEGCGRYARFGYIACRKHVRQRRREIRRHGYPVVAATALKEAA